jgi:hypothetical protein
VRAPSKLARGAGSRPALSAPAPSLHEYEDLLSLLLLSVASIPPALLAVLGLPDAPYPPSVTADLAQFPSGSRDWLIRLLNALHEASSDGGAAWQQIEPAIARVAELLAADQAGGNTLQLTGHNWWLEIGAVDLSAQLVTVQRGDRLIAALVPREDRRLRAAVFRPLDAKSAGYLRGLAQLLDPEDGLGMGRDNWDYALDSAASNGRWYAYEAADAYLSSWQFGLGLDWERAVLPVWQAQRGLVARPAVQVAAELAAHDICGGVKAPEVLVV